MYKTLFQNVINVLPIIYENKNKMPRKNKNAWFIYKKLQVRSVRYKLFGNNFWWSCLECSDKMGLTIRMRMSSNVNHRETIYFKF